MALQGVFVKSAGAPTGTSTPPTDTLPGSFNADMGNPLGASAENVKQQEDFVSGLGQALFGKDTGSLFGGVPVVGDVVRAVADVPGVKLATDVSAQVAGGGIGVATAALSHVPLGWLPGGSDATFNALPKTPEWQAVNEASNRDILGGGNLKFDYTQKFLEDQQANIARPEGLATLSPGLLAGPGGSLGGFIGQVLGLAQLPQRYVERAIAGAAKVFTGNRVQETLQRAAAGETDLSPVELAVVQHVGDGSWDEQRALDFMASHGSGLSHDRTLELVGNFATDPTVVLSLGAAGVAKLGVRGAELVAQGAEASNFLDRAGVAVHGVEQSLVGDIAKIARSTIDPLSAIGGRTPAGRATVDLYADDVATQAFLGAHTSDLGANVFRLGGQLGMDADAMLRAAANRGAAYARDILAREKQGQIIVTQRAEGLFTPVKQATLAMSDAPKDIVNAIRESAYATRSFLWDDTRKAELAHNLSVAFGGDEEAIAARLAKASDGDLGLLHDLVYAKDEKDFRAAADSSAFQYTGRTPYDRLNLMNQSTLTDLGAQGFLKRVAAVSTEEEKVAVLSEYQRLYPEMKRYGVNVRFSEDDLTAKLAQGREGSLPSMVTDAEMSKMPQRVQDFMRDHPNRTLGFRPADGALWNVERSPVTGMLEATGTPWVEHVFDQTPYRPGYDLPFNIAGQTVRVTSPVKALDWLEAGPRLLNKRVSGAMVRANAEQRFIKTAVGSGKLSESTARDLFRGLTEHLDTSAHPTVLSQSATDIWSAAQAVLPAGSNINRRDVLRWLVDGFEGDLSVVGAAQKIANKLRSTVTAATGFETNAWYEVSQGLYSNLRFRYPTAVLFKAQEAIEPAALNVTEGTRIGKASAGDLELKNVLDNLSASSILRGKDQTDILEFSNFALRNRSLEGAIAKDQSRFAHMFLPDLSALKRTAQMKMIGNRLGTEVRNAFQAAGQEADFDAFKSAYADAIGRPVTDSEYAVHWLNGLQQASLSLKSDGTHISVQGLLDEAAMWSPADVGEVKPLALDSVSAQLDGLKGHGIHSFDGLVASMRARSNVAPASIVGRADVRAALESIAPRQYVDRFMSALDFSFNEGTGENGWRSFWRDAEEHFNLLPDESRNLQKWVADIAATQSMKPTEFLSQVVASGMRQTWTKQEVLDNLSKGLAVIRAPKDAQAEALIGQLVDAFIGHLQPSGREALAKALVRNRNDVERVAYEASHGVLDQLTDAEAREFADLLTARAKQGGEAAARPTGGIGSLVGAQAFQDAALENAYRYFGDWARATLKDQALGTGRESVRELLAGLPQDGKAFDHTQGALLDAVFARIRGLENDSYRAQFFARDRSLLERSLNHPLFGLYPSSYMWWKIAPRMLRFIADTPFGLKTGALAYALADVQKDVAIQREFDPEFAKMLDGAANNPALWFLSYLLPATPWDVPSAWPAWARDLAGQGLAQQAAAQAGKTPKSTNLLSPVTRSFDMFSPSRPVTQTTRALAEVGNIAFGSSREQKATPGQTGVAAGIAAPLQAASGALASIGTNAVADLEAWLNGTR